ncbi:MAG: hypothetical protein ACMUIP_14005 [bacterium]
MEVKFVRSEVQEIVPIGEVALTITGTLLNGTTFHGTDSITVINPGKNDKKTKKK